MYVRKVFNNNVILVADNLHNYILVGKGIGFHKKANDQVKSINKSQLYINADDKWSSMLIKLISNISIEYLEISSLIIEKATKVLESSFDEYLLLVLTDHINFAVLRHMKRMDIKNEILLETKNYYPKEFAIGVYALQVIKDKVNVSLPEDEAGFIALKFVDSSLDDSGKQDAIILTKTISGAIQIVEKDYGSKLDKESISWQRFLVHLRFFLARAVNDKKNVKNVPDDMPLYKYISNRYLKTFKCAQRISDYVESVTHSEVSINEKVYLTIHLERIFMEEE
ncbi:PRD domain-containing protein [Lactobacillus paracasei subsp. paracasei]|uniref:PRD domain-containing protein n=1 Tax=Lacticaseibacillus paracasei TaxID=1597 RepID=UPI0018C6AC7F|nr:PRD domain-containing protein [Lacticaseibacillus paracasei]MBG1272265.1 PRD domain-containing protein [Lacticaseibacillus paracasei subsp. paracasei]